MERARHYQTATRDLLTPRQREVLDLIARGKTNGEIAEQLGITLDGAKFHVREILAKLGEEAAAWWRASRGARLSRLRDPLRGLVGGISLKPVATVAGAAVVSAVAGCIAFAVWNGPENTEALPRCDPDRLSWSTESTASLDDPGRVTYTAFASAWSDCELSAVVGVGAYAAQFDTPASGLRGSGGGTILFGAGPRIAVAIENQAVGPTKRPLISGSVANICGAMPDVLLVIQTPAQTSYRLGAPAPPCTDPGSPMQFEAEWTASKHAREAALHP